MASLTTLLYVQAMQLVKAIYSLSQKKEEAIYSGWHNDRHIY
jgi:hypothetical protein